MEEPQREYERIQYSKEYIESNADQFNVIDWINISETCVLSKVGGFEFIKRFSSEFNWERLCANKTFTQEYIEYFIDKVSWAGISRKTWDEDFIDKYKEKIYWPLYSCHSRTMTDRFVKKYEDYVCWEAISRWGNISERTFEEYSDKILWDLVDKNRSFSMEFMKRNQDKLNWKSLSENHLLTEIFILEFQDYIHWPTVKKRALSWEGGKLSESFKRQYIYKMRTSAA